METALTVGSILPASVGLGCCLRRQNHWLGLVAMVVMLCGMIDAMPLGGRLLPEAGWVVLFTLAAAAQFMAAEPMRIIRIAELGVMGLLIVTTPSMTSEHATSGVHDMGGMDMSGMATSSSPAQSFVVLLALAAAATYIAYAASRFARAENPLSRLELGMSVVSVGAMSAMLVI